MPQTASIILDIGNEQATAEQAAFNMFIVDSL